MEVIKKKSAGCFVIKKQKEEYFVLLQKKNWQNGTIGWVPPKGSIELNESEKTAAKRETREETGLQSISIIKKIKENRYSFKENNKTYDKTVVWFLATTTTMNLGDKNLTRQEKKTQKEVEWIKVDNALDLLVFEDEKRILEEVKQLIYDGKIPDIK
ncbi:MAG: NUDIX domain-containing protein [Candidatus Dojkabacteria bacterium]|nr:NUDIX domain-containing protein [Candidatus Dojkabacteria bacterium]